MPKSLGRYSVAVKVFPNGINPADRTIQTIVMGLFGHTTRKSSLRNQNLTTFSFSGKKYKFYCSSDPVPFWPGVRPEVFDMNRSELSPIVPQFIRLPRCVCCPTSLGLHPNEPFRESSSLRSSRKAASMARFSNSKNSTPISKTNGNKTARKSWSSPNASRSFASYAPNSPRWNPRNRTTGSPNSDKCSKAKRAPKSDAKPS